jgi:hypothetical protein
VVISGKSSNSTGGQGALHQHISKIDDVEHLPEDTKKLWSEKIPRYWTGPTIWAESVVKSLNACGMGEMENELNYNFLYAKLYLFNFRQRKEIFRDFKKNIFSTKFLISFIFQFFDRTLVFLRNRFKIKITVKENLGAIDNAVRVLQNSVNRKKLPF